LILSLKSPLIIQDQVNPWEWEVGLERGIQPQGKTIYTRSFNLLYHQFNLSRRSSIGSWERQGSYNEGKGSKDKSRRRNKVCFWPLFSHACEETRFFAATIRPKIASQNCKFKNGGRSWRWKLVGGVNFVDLVDIWPNWKGLLEGWLGAKRRTWSRALGLGFLIWSRFDKKTRDYFLVLPLEGFFPRMDPITCVHCLFLFVLDNRLLKRHNK